MNNSVLTKNIYLWAVGSISERFCASELIAERYRVIAPQIWQDTDPEKSPFLPEQLPVIVITYLKLYPYRFHVPEVYGVCPLENSEVILLENIPVDDRGNLYPSLHEAWLEAPPIWQVYWLWQIWDLWNPLAELGVAASLLVPDNLRVEGWRLRLRELSTRSQDGVTLEDLGASWIALAKSAHFLIADALSEIVELLIAGEISFKNVTANLNQLLLELAARQPLRVKVASGTATGRKPQHNEDSYYPTESDLTGDRLFAKNFLASHLTIVCDGLGGHEGGEVASRIAVESIRLQLGSLLAEFATETEIILPDLVAQELATIIRVANNLIYSRNQEQGKKSRQRMATTLVMALQLPQQVFEENSHEIYLAHVGDSRAYWITQDRCRLLTVDDDVASREVRLGRCLYRDAMKRPDAIALSQALGARDGESLRPTIQRLVLSEDGVLLLCSDGLSDNDLVEKYWQDFIPDVINGKNSLENAVQALLELAEEKNGRDNISIVATAYGVSQRDSVVFNASEFALANAEENFEPFEFDLEHKTTASESPGAIVPWQEPGPIQVRTPNPKPIKRQGVSWAVWFLTILLAVAIGFFLPSKFEQIRDRLPVISDQ